MARYPILTGELSIATKNLIAALIAVLVGIIVLASGLLRREQSDPMSIPANQPESIETDSSAGPVPGARDIQEMSPSRGSSEPGEQDAPEGHTIKREDPDLPRMTITVDDAEVVWQESGRRPPAPSTGTPPRDLNLPGSGAAAVGSGGPSVVSGPQSGLPPEHGALRQDGPDAYPEGSDVIVSIPEEGDPGVIHLPPEASDPGISFPAPESGDPGLVYPAPEDEGPVIDPIPPEGSGN